MGKEYQMFHKKLDLLLSVKLNKKYSEVISDIWTKVNVSTGNEQRCLDKDEPTGQSSKYEGNTLQAFRDSIDSWWSWEMWSEVASIGELKDDTSNANRKERNTKQRELRMCVFTGERLKKDIKAEYNQDVAKLKSADFDEMVQKLHERYSLLKTWYFCTISFINSSRNQPHFEKLICEMENDDIIGKPAGPMTWLAIPVLVSKPDGNITIIAFGELLSFSFHPIIANIPNAAVIQDIVIAATDMNSHNNTLQQVSHLVTCSFVAATSQDFQNIPLSQINKSKMLDNETNSTKQQQLKKNASK
eukprot:gene4536-20788_t